MCRIIFCKQFLELKFGEATGNNLLRDGNKREGEVGDFQAGSRRAAVLTPW